MSGVSETPIKKERTAAAGMSPLFVPTLDVGTIDKERMVSDEMNNAKYRLAVGGIQRIEKKRADITLTN